MEYVRKASKISNLLSDYNVENESEKIKKVNKLKKQRSRKGEILSDINYDSDDNQISIKNTRRVSHQSLHRNSMTKLLHENIDDYNKDNDINNKDNDDNTNQKFDKHGSSNEFIKLNLTNSIN